MSNLDTGRVRRNLRRVIDEVDDAIRDMSEAGGDRLEQFKERTGQRLHAARARLDELEHHAGARARTMGRQTRDYVLEHPWITIGGVVALMLVAGALSRTRI